MGKLKITRGPCKLKNRKECDIFEIVKKHIHTYIHTYVCIHIYTYTRTLMTLSIERFDNTESQRTTQSYNLLARKRRENLTHV